MLKDSQNYLDVREAFVAIVRITESGLACVSSKAMRTCTVYMILNLLYDYMPRKPVLLLWDEVITGYRL